MKYLAFILLGLIPVVVKSQAADTLINVGKYSLHFTIIKGKGTPILFEAGGGNDGGIWKGITQSVAEATGAPVITYDRAGLGKSSNDSTQPGIVKEVEGLETALNKLGYRDKIMLVSHSIGGFYNAVYVSRHPKDVQAIVLIDVNHACFFTDEQLKNMQASQNFRNTVEYVKNNPFPYNIPTVDIVSEKTLFEGTPDAARWRACHHDFVAASPNRKELVAYETGHYVFRQNRPLVINCIVTTYANYVMPSRKAAILEKGYALALIADNEDRRSLMNYWHSEDDLNEWGYSFFQKNEMDKAIEIFTLNATLHPGSANVYDSLGDAYLKKGNKELAIKNYKKALELDPNKISARKALDQLLK